MGQTGFFDLERRLDALSAKGDPLETIKAVALLLGQPADPILRISIVDDNILALNPPQIAQRLPERVEQGRPIGGGVSCS